MRATNEADRLAKRLAAADRDRLRAGPGTSEPGLEGCGDHGCVVRPPQGVGTNGGCRCSEVVLRRMIAWQAREIARLRAEQRPQDRTAATDGWGWEARERTLREEVAVLTAENERLSALLEEDAPEVCGAVLGPGITCVRPRDHDPPCWRADED